MRAALLGLAGPAVLLAACGENLTPPGEGEPSPPLACVPDLDGVLTAEEIPLVLGATAPYLIGGDVAVDVAGEGAGATRRWDWSVERRDDTAADLGAVALDRQWYASAFPGGQFVAAGAGGLDGVYARDAAAIYLLGLASPTMEPASARTLLAYDAPVAVLRFPLVEGDAWTATGTITGGTLAGLPYSGADVYELSADASGELHLPYVRFTRALRLRTRVVSTPAVGGVVTSRRQVSFWFECMGELGRATSRADEPAADFTIASELRRFAL
ncbi:MAG: hypothetical protein HS111_31980 [Kofleriaceae bacterium]|nr:hypothetical protein [Kofleriaceae bacterium]MCL4228673.1 hypothetical protein [Myxococcales bacterium]